MPLQKLKKQILDFDSPAMTYFKESLSYGKTLANLVLNEVDLTHGQLFTFIPVEIDASKIINFRWAFSSQPHLSSGSTNSFVRTEPFLKKVSKNKVKGPSTITRA